MRSIAHFSIRRRRRTGGSARGPQQRFSMEEKMENILEKPDGYREYILDFPLEDIHSIVQEWCGRYDRKFRKLAAEQRSINYAAGFFGAVWAAYRGMWKNAFILLGLEALYSFLLNLAALFLIRLYPEWQLKVLFWGLHLCIFGILGEKMYFNHVFGLLRSVKNRTASMEENIFPDRYCGTHVGYALLMMVLRIIVNLFLAIIINVAAAFLLFSHPVFFS